MSKSDEWVRIREYFDLETEEGVIKAVLAALQSLTDILFYKGNKRVLSQTALNMLGMLVLELGEEKEKKNDE